MKDTGRLSGLGLGTMPEFLDRSRFPVDPWRLTERRYESSDLGVTETLFALGNGYLGLRGNVEEGRDTFAHGTFVNGFHETWPIRHAEEAYGYARIGQTIANVPDAKVIRLYVDDEPLLLTVADLPSYERTVDFRSGVLSRDVVWLTTTGNRVRVRSQRLVSMVQRHLAVMTFEVTLLDHAAPVVISSQVLNREAGVDEYDTSNAHRSESVDPRRARAPEGRVLQPKVHWSDDHRAFLGYRCTDSRMTLAVAVDHTIETENEVRTYSEASQDHTKHVFGVDAEAGKPIRLTKVVAYHTSRAVPPRELVNRCQRTLDRVTQQGVDRQFADQKEWLTGFWERSDVELEGQPAAQQAVRFNLFQLAQAAARAGGHGIAAKGVTGTGYSGHYFWDTEVYVVPFFVYTTPQIARNALRFRYTMLPAAERRAKDLTTDGVLFPWRTINGQEASAYYAAGTAQYHINADISFAIDKYVKATSDEDFLARAGIDILVQTARMWLDLGFWRGDGEASFRIHGVTGPDEYTTVVNDNLYTNVMARFNLRCAAHAVRELDATRHDAHAQMVARLGLRADEAAEWERAAEAIVIPWDDHLGIHPQDSQFVEREVWDLPNTPPEKRPLLLHYHPLVIYRFQVLKQADVVLALFLQGDQFTPAEKKADFEYYDPITTGDSSLSSVVQAIIAAEVGYHQMALSYFWQSLYVDLGNLHENTSDGIHVASAGGVWGALVYGFGGMRDCGGDLTFDPRLPSPWSALTFRVTVRGTRLLVTLRQDAITFAVEEGMGARLSVRGRDVSVTPSSPVRVELNDQGPRIDGEPEPVALRPHMRDDGTLITAAVPHHSGLNK